MTHVSNGKILHLSNSTVIGHYNMVNGNGNNIIGNNNTVNGDNSTVMGNNNIIDGDTIQIIGNNNFNSCSNKCKLIDGENNKTIIKHYTTKNLTAIDTTTKDMSSAHDNMVVNGTIRSNAIIQDYVPKLRLHENDWCSTCTQNMALFTHNPCQYMKLCYSCALKITENNKR